MARAPPPEIARVQPRTSPESAPAWGPAQPATGEQGVGQSATARDSTRAASHLTEVRASVGASAARDKRAGRRPGRRRPRPHACTQVVGHSVGASAARDGRVGRRSGRRLLRLTEMRVSMGARAARGRRAGWRSEPRRRRPWPCGLAFRRGAYQRRGQRVPRPAGRVATRTPPIWDRKRVASRLAEVRASVDAGAAEASQ